MTDILYIEDERSISGFSLRKLNSIGKTQLCENLPGAIDAFDAMRASGKMPKIIVSDWDIPGGTGFDFWKHAVKNGYAGPMLFVSANSTELHATRNDPANRQLLENVEFLPKPYTLAKLEAKVRQMLGGPSAPSSAPTTPPTGPQP
jgi:DNA-binding response OmpR family regulator